MADYKVTDTELTSIANAIRAKTGKEAQIEFPTEFVSEIGSISGGEEMPNSAIWGGLKYTRQSGGNKPLVYFDAQNSDVYLTKEGAYAATYAFKHIVPASAKKILIRASSSDYYSPYYHVIGVYRNSDYTAESGGSVPTGSTLLAFLANGTMSAQQLNEQERVTMNTNNNVALPLQTVEIDISDISENFYLVIHTENQVMRLYEIEVSF